jgi:lysophospholipase L1-like esterase
MPFFAKLRRIASGDPEQAVIVHIGDSHVQPGQISAALRKSLQQKYGNAGRGVIFPYRVAKSNGPDGYASSADTPWIASRLAAPKQTLPTGIAGFALWSQNKSPSFGIKVLDPQIFGVGINKVIIYHDDGDTSMPFTLINFSDSTLYPRVESLHPGQSAFQVNGTPGEMIFRARRSKDSLQSATLFGITITGDTPGVVLHTIGVNGATFSNYLNSKYFPDHLATLKPDLIILSLGTNEAVARTFNPDSLKATMDSLISSFRKKGIDAGILFTTPPAIYKGYRKNRRTHYKPSTNAALVRETILNFASEKGYASWDWYTIMGGRQSMAKWKAKRMTDRRYIHFSPKGYSIQGSLLNEAFQKLNADFGQKR